MRRLVNALFWVADGVAWLMVMVFAAFGIGAPLVAPIVLRMRSEPPPSVAFLAGLILWCAVAALGCYLIARRRPVGLVVMLAACSVLMVGGSGVLGFLVAGFSLAVFGSPWVLAYIEWRQHAEKHQET